MRRPRLRRLYPFISGNRWNFSLYFRATPFSDTLDLCAKPAGEGRFVAARRRGGYVLGEGDADSVASMLADAVSPWWERLLFRLRRHLRH